LTRSTKKNRPQPTIYARQNTDRRPVHQAPTDPAAMLSTFSRKIAVPLVPKSRRAGDKPHEKPFASGGQAGGHSSVTN
jgi:hypothetical protein